MEPKNVAAVVLAGGKGTRMQSPKPKVLHKIGGQPMIFYALNNLYELGLKDIYLVIGFKAELVKKAVEKIFPVKFALQEQPLGTGHAVQTALKIIGSDYDHVLVVNGDDSAFYSQTTLRNFIDSHVSSKAAVSLMTLKLGDQNKLGKIMKDENNKFSKVLEDKEYQDGGYQTDEVNCGAYLFDLSWLQQNINSISLNPAKGEYYINDLPNLAAQQGLIVNLFTLKDTKEWVGVNSRDELKYANLMMKERKFSTTQYTPPSEVEQNFLRPKWRSTFMKTVHFMSKALKEPTAHFMGIGGSGASAAAAIAQAAGFRVTGCDQDPVNEFTSGLDCSTLSSGHSASHLTSGNVDILAISPAITSLDPNNQEIKAARQRGIEVLTWQQFVGKYLQTDKFIIAISGTHGKSTTTAMIAKLLVDANLDPTVILGATVPEWGTNYRIPSQTHHDREYFVIEADEYNDNFLNYIPNITVVTNIEMDHPEYFKSFKEYEDSFYKFLLKTRETIVANITDPAIAHILKDLMKEIPVTAIDYSKHELNFPLEIPGTHNRLNAQAAFQVGLILGIDPEIIRNSLAAFAGISRRFEYVGEFKRAKVYMDFGHHPTEIKTTIQAAREKFPNQKLWLVYEPHMFSRTKVLFDDFVKVFKSLPVDQTILLDIYPSREKDTGLVKSQMLVHSTNKPNVRYNSPEEIKETLNREIRPGDVIFFMGAGNIDKLARKLTSTN